MSVWNVDWADSTTLWEAFLLEAALTWPVGSFETSGLAIRGDRRVQTVRAAML